MPLIATDPDPRVELERFCEQVEAGVTVDPGALQAAAKKLRDIMDEDEQIPAGGKTPGRPPAFSLNNPAAFEHVIAIVEDYENRRAAGSGSAAQSTAEKFSIGRRTVERYIARGSVQRLAWRVWKAGAKLGQQIQQQHAALAGVVEQIRRRRRPVRDYVQLHDTGMIVRQLTLSQEREFNEQQWDVKDRCGHYRCLDWLFSHCVYENQEANEPFGDAIKITESPAPYTDIFINSLHELYDL